MSMTLKAARVNAGLTQREAVALYNDKHGTRLAVTTLLKWERNQTFPTVPQFKALCELYGVEMGDISVPDTLPLR